MRGSIFIVGGTDSLCTRKGSLLASHSEARAVAVISWGVARLWDIIGRTSLQNNVKGEKVPTDPTPNFE